MVPLSLGQFAVEPGVEVALGLAALVIAAVLYPPKPVLMPSAVLWE